MTRIIAGRAGSITLEVPDAGTRPTSDRVRESLFGALESADALQGAAVLDLYAGSGALGLEAVSRGAASADLVEKSPRAAADRGAQRGEGREIRGAGCRDPRPSHPGVGIPGRPAAGRYDLVFLDPPYDLDEPELTHALALLIPSLTPRRDRRRRARGAVARSPSCPTGLVHARDRKYGDTVLWWVAALGLISRRAHPSRGRGPSRRGHRAAAVDEHRVRRRAARRVRSTRKPSGSVEPAGKVASRA